MRAAGAVAPVWAACSLAMVKFIGPAFLAVSHGRRTPAKRNAPSSRPPEYNHSAVYYPAAMTG